ncbi:MAG: hypothetical protein ABIF10_06320 [Candidatus Woesearchaeota archaeon]
MKAIILLIGAMLAAAVVAAHESPELDNQVFFVGDTAEGVAYYNPWEFKFKAWDLEPKTWFTLIGKINDEVVCLGMRKTDCEGHVRICGDLEQCLSKMEVVLMPSRDVECFGDTMPVPGKILDWNPELVED